MPIHAWGRPFDLKYVVTSKLMTDTIMSSTSSTRPKRPVIPASRPGWAIEWSRADRERRGLPPLPSSPSPTSPPQHSLPSSDFSVSAPDERSASRLSNHLTKEEQDVQALSNDRVQQRALPANRHPTDLRVETSPTPPFSRSNSRGWDDIGDHTPRAQSVIQPEDLVMRGPIRIEPSKVHEELLKKESIRPPVFGGRSKNQQLGSVAESWGADPTIEIPKGMFELADDPPSPVLDRELTPEELRLERARRAALGIPAEKSGRPSIKEMIEMEKLSKMKNQHLRAERQRNDIDMSQVGLVDPFPVINELIVPADAFSDRKRRDHIDQA